MRLFRLTQKKYASDPFNPIGAKLYGGRWNSKGTEALYFSISESLCTLEVLVHVNSDRTIIDLYDLFSIDLSLDLIAQLALEDLPENWRDIPSPRSTQLIGDEFLKLPYLEAEHAYAALQVPSVISPRESNFLVNPHHPEMKAVLANAVKIPIQFDPRIFN